MRTTNRSTPHQSSQTVISRVMQQVVEPHRQWLNQPANPPTPAPPNALPAAYNEAHALTQQLHRMAFADGLPTANSQGLERLLFRLVRVNEEVVAILAEIVTRSSATAHPVGWQGGVATDEGYQSSFCDSCGGELTPAGTCINPGCAEFGG